MMSNEKQTNPIKGLLPYYSRDSDFYYVNQAQAESFFRQLEKNHFIVLTGNTGTGKTSFVNCIFNDRFADISNIDEHWNIVYIRPGLNPLKSIAYFLSNSNFSRDTLRNAFVKETTDLLTTDTNGLYELFCEYRIKQGGKLLLVIDPLDDLFLLASVMQQTASLAPAQHVDAFINLLCTFEQQIKDLPIYTVLSFSNSFPEKVGLYPRFLDLVEKDKFVFKSVDIAKVAAVIDEIIPENCKRAKDYNEFKEKVKKDIETEFKYTSEWLFFLQHAIKQTIDLWNKDRNKEMCKCYEAIGGVKESIIRHAELIYNKKIAQTGKKYERIYELIFRTFIDGKGQFVPKTYGVIVDMSTRFYQNDNVAYLEKNIINPFIHLLAERELGFFEIIRSMEESDRTRSLNDKSFIANTDVISIRNKCLISKWPRLETFLNAKVKLINEYEWYSRIAFEKMQSGRENYPTTLQAYALADSNRDRKEDPEEFKVIEDLLNINEAWEQSVFEKGRKGFASVSDTKTYIQKGIDHWIEKAADEEKTRKKKEKRKTLITYISSITLIAFIICFPLYKILLVKFDKVKSEYDCLVAENYRVVSFIDSMQIAKLREHALRNEVSPNTINKLKDRANILTKKLKSRAQILEAEANDLFSLTELDFLFNLSDWKKKRAAQIDSCASDINDVLTAAIQDNIITTIDSIETPQKIWIKYKNVEDLNNDDYPNVHYTRFKGVKEFTYTTLDGHLTQIPMGYTYYLRCENCGDCK